jgi:hypothetical protein
VQKVLTSSPPWGRTELYSVTLRSCVMGVLRICFQHMAITPAHALYTMQNNACHKPHDKPTLNACITDRVHDPSRESMIKMVPIWSKLGSQNESNQSPCAARMFIAIQMINVYSEKQIEAWMHIHFNILAMREEYYYWLPFHVCNLVVCDQIWTDCHGWLKDLTKVQRGKGSSF